MKQHYFHKYFLLVVVFELFVGLIFAIDAVVVLLVVGPIAVEHMSFGLVLLLVVVVVVERTSFVQVLLVVVGHIGFVQVLLVVVVEHFRMKKVEIFVVLPIFAF
jgi:hypothetical protein